jgi:hypothetical protein
MSCDRYRDAIVDHACGAEIAGEAKAHLEQCVDCQQTFALQARATARLDRELEAALAVQPSPRFVSETMARVQESKRTRHYGTWWLGAAAAAAAAVVLLSIGLLRNEPQPERKRDSPLAQSAPSSLPVAPAQIESPQPPERTPVRSTTGGAVKSARVVAAAKGRNTPPRLVAEPYRVSSFRDVPVVVPPGQAEALARYLALVRQGAFVPPSPVRSADAELSIPDPVIAPLSVEPLNVVEMTPDTSSGTQPGTNKE